MSEEPVTPQEQQPDQPIGPPLNVVDIVDATKTIKVALERNAFRPEEVGEVGMLYSRLLKFSDYVEATLSKQSKEKTSSENV